MNPDTGLRRSWRVRRVLLLAALLLAGCASAPPATTTTPAPSATTWLAPAILGPTDATWPPFDAAQLGMPEPLSLRLEERWSGDAPDNVTLALRVQDMEAPLPITWSMGSASRGPGYDPAQWLTINLTGGLAPLMHSAPDLVRGDKLVFANRTVVFPVLNATASLVVRGARGGAPFAQNATLAPREATTLPNLPWFSNRLHQYGLQPHPGGFLHSLEDGALVVWAENGTILGSGSNGTLDHDVAGLDVLAITGMGGWIEAARDEG